MLKFETKGDKHILVSVTAPENQITLEEESETRFFGEIVFNDSNEYQFTTSPQEYFHALWWVSENDMEELKNKIYELNDT